MIVLNIVKKGTMKTKIIKFVYLVQLILSFVSNANQRISVYNVKILTFLILLNKNVFLKLLIAQINNLVILRMGTIIVHLLVLKIKVFFVFNLLET